jgi:glycosyltransferase involved in cell wall biosynthesis
MSGLRASLLEAALFFGMAAAAGVALRRTASSREIAASTQERKRGRLKILIVTDAWPPQINGVVRTLDSLGRELESLGHEVRYATPEHHTTLPIPTYPEIRLAIFPRAGLAALIDEFQPDAIHIATEATMGFAARAICLERRLKFTTSFHTRFPDYIHARFPFIPESAVYGALKSFHAPAAAVMVATPSLKRELESHGFQNVKLWSRGVDVEHFKPGPKDGFEKLGCVVERPVFLYVGRLALEKNIEAFLKLDLPGTKVVIGDGPERAELEARHTAVRFLGRRTGEELVSLYASSDVFVFPSRTDTFGLVLLEALACGVPVAAYRVQAPLDVIGEAGVAEFDEDLRAGCLAALLIPRGEARNFALTRTWRASAQEFLSNLAMQRQDAG